MNELIFFIHIILVSSLTLGALRLGKEALICIIALQAVLENLFVIKQVDLFGFHVTCCDVFAIGGVLGLNLLNEYYGKKTARDAVWLSFASMVVFGIMSQVHILYTPNGFDVAHSSYMNLLTPAPRILGASFMAYFVSSRLDVWVYGLLKSSVDSIIFRSGITLVVSQLVDTTLFSMLGLYGMVHSILDIIVVSFIIKLIVIAIATPFSAFSKRLVHEV